MPVVKAEAGEEEPDFGGPEEDAAEAKPKIEVGGPQRAMPDYGDLVDDDGPAPSSTKEELGASARNAPQRKEGILVRGVARLTRTHLAELFEVKRLPVFKWVEWIADDQAICVWEDPRDAATAFKGAATGFGDTGDLESPGPGLWRAQRCMMDFRMATEDDKPTEDFKKKHRGGKQVREFRFWECMKDMSSNILGEQEMQGMKRPLVPSGEDTFAAADFDDDVSRRKRLRAGMRPGEDEEEIDLLQKMAELDRAILAKQELNDEGVPVSKVNDTSLVKHESYEEERQAKSSDEGKRKAGSTTWGSWQHDDRWGDDGNAGGQGDEREEWKKGDGRKRRRADGDGGGGERKGGRKGGGKGDGGTGDGGGGGRAAKAVEGFEVAADDDEQARRAKRADRFKK
mmetsp:Transcript_51256/g.166185  ORF Transcript_51256/g.166185 Transcript_51256/m.166185 type:complete len:399 (+) Transcript_51256:115-1311(+)